MVFFGAIEWSDSLKYQQHRAGRGAGAYQKAAAGGRAIFPPARETLTPYQERIPLHGGGFVSPGTIREWATNVAPGGSLDGYTATVG